MIRQLVVLLFLLAGPALADSHTRYPIILVHGLFGFDKLMGVDYFYGIPQALTRDGATVYVAQVSATNSSEARGEQLLTQVQQVLAITGAEKVNLIGHSHGGPTVRYVASVAPELVASATSVGGVNQGSAIADLVRVNAPPGSAAETLASSAAQALSGVISLLSGGGKLPQDPIKALDALTSAGATEFNRHYPEGLPTTPCGEGPMRADNGVHYFSWSGRGNLTNILDPVDPALVLTGLFFDEPNDGLVGVCSSHLGKVIGTGYKMNHLDEVNHSFGIRHLFETDPVSLYVQHARRLKDLGL
ncbi:lipase [Aeromonas diversa CDC 2478-85]|uniref:Lipase n=1 Tax=Aeromonas diversa CDC 2478-85 TaxID=1268237 RepID=N9U2J2_9GAMM|nr:triacylglycerol lipase [Aeromonas diversa]ENY72589.1 lipase [Aeromonas diversa CDC 2478-85]